MNHLQSRNQRQSEHSERPLRRKVSRGLAQRWEQMCKEGKFEEISEEIEGGSYCVYNSEWLWEIVCSAAWLGHVWFIKFIHSLDPHLFSRGSEFGVHNSHNGNHIPLITMRGLMAEACSRMGNVEMIQYLLSVGCDPNEKNFDGPPIFQVAERGDLPMMKALLLGGADIHRPDWFRPTGSLFYPSSLDSSLLAVVAYRKFDPHGNSTPEALMELVRFVLKLHLSKNLKIDQSDLHNNTALSFAARRNNPDVVALLLHHGADMKIRNNLGQTPLDLNIIKLKLFIQASRVQIDCNLGGLPTRDDCGKCTNVMKMLGCSQVQRVEILDALAQVMHPYFNVLDIPEVWGL
jgi:hypothetical protein